MTDTRTIAIFGAGPGLGASLATTFGKEGYHVALVARRAETLDKQVADLASTGIEAAAFPADLTDIAGIPALIRNIEQRFGTIDIAVYAPVPPGLGFVPAAELDAATAQALAPIFTFAPIEVAHEVLPGMLARGNGAIVIVSGVSAVFPFPGMSGPGPLLAAARQYVLTLNAEVAQQGVYAGSVSIGGSVARSDSHTALLAAGIELGPDVPVIDPDDIAREIRTLVTERDRAEAIIPPMPMG